jgi:2-haloalkanoic acid dehalogenase type II
MDFSAVTSLSFDCYGTLIDWETGIVEAVARLHPGVALDPERVLTAYAAAETPVEREHPGLRYSAVVELAYAELARRLELPSRPGDARRFAGSIGDWPPFADSPAALAALARRFTLVVLSNVDRESFARSEARLGVTFDRVFTAEDIGSYKPDRRNFEHMLERLARTGTAPEALVHVAQSRYHDIEPAKALGLRAVWVDRRHGRDGWGATPPPTGGVEPDLTVRSLEELVALST